MAPPEWTLLSEPILEEPQQETPEAFQQAQQTLTQAQQPQVQQPDAQLPNWADQSEPLFDRKAPSMMEELKGLRPFKMLKEDEFKVQVEQAHKQARDTEYDWSSRIQRGSENLPYGGAIAANRLMNTAAAAWEKEDGTLTENGAQLIGEFYAELDRKKDLNTLDEVMELALSIPGFFAEIAVSGGAFTVVNRGTQAAMLKALRKLGSEYLQKKLTRGVVAKATRKVAGWAVGSAAFSAMNPQLIAEQTSDRALRMALNGEEEDFAEALRGGVLGGYFELSSEMAGGQIVRLLSKATGFNKLMRYSASRWLQLNPRSNMGNFLNWKNKVGWHGILEEIEEERLVDVMRGLSGIDEDFGTTGKLFSSDPEVRAEGWRQIGIEGAAFAIIGGPGAVMRGKQMLGKHPIDHLETFIKDPSRTKFNKIRKNAKKLAAAGVIPDIGEQVEIEGKTVPFDPGDLEHRKWFADKLAPIVDSANKQMADAVKAAPEAPEDVEAKEDVEDAPEAPPEPVTPSAGLPVIATSSGFEGEKRLVMLGPVRSATDKGGQFVVWNARDAETDEIHQVRSTDILSSEGEAFGAKKLPGRLKRGQRVIAYPLTEHGEDAHSEPGEYTLVKAARGEAFKAAGGQLWSTKNAAGEKGPTVHRSGILEVLDTLAEPAAEEPAPAAEPLAEAEEPAPAAEREREKLQNEAEAAHRKMMKELQEKYPDAVIGKFRAGARGSLADRTSEEDNEYVGRAFHDGLIEVEVTAEEDNHPDLPDEQKQRYIKEQLSPSVRSADGELLQKASVIIGTRPKAAPAAAEGDPRLAELFEEEFEQALEEHKPGKTAMRIGKWLEKFLAREELEDEMPGLSEKGERIFNENKLTPSPAAKLVKGAWERAKSKMEKESDQEEFDQEQLDEQREFEERVGFPPGTEVRWTDPETNEYRYGTVTREKRYEKQSRRGVIREVWDGGWDLRVQTRDGEEFTIFEGEISTGLAKDLEPFEIERPGQKQMFAEQPAAEPAAPAAAEEPGPPAEPDTLDPTTTERWGIHYVDDTPDVKQGQQDLARIGSRELRERAQRLKKDKGPGYTKEQRESHLATAKQYEEQADELERQADALDADEPAAPREKVYTKPPMLEGNDTTISVAGAEKIPAVYAVMELSDITASHRATADALGVDFQREPDYPDNIQPREYERGNANAKKVEDHARAKEPGWFLSDMPDATSGPPTVTPEGVVINGNGRIMTLQLAYAEMEEVAEPDKPGTTEAEEESEWYWNALIDKARSFGLNPSDVDDLSMEPVLVRVVDMHPESAEAAEFADRGNVSATFSESPERLAASLAGLVGDENLINTLPWDSGDTLVKMLEGKSGKRFREMLRKKLADSNRDQYISDDLLLTASGADLVQNMFLSVVFDIKALVNLHDNAKYLRNSLQGVLPELLAIKRAFPDADLAPAITEAALWIRHHQDVQTRSQAAELLRSSALPGMELDEKETISPAGRMMLDLLLDIGAKPRVLRRALKAVRKRLDEERGGMFASKDKSNSKIIAAALKEWDIEERPGAEFGGEYTPAVKMAPERERPPADSATEIPVPEGATTRPMSEAQARDEVYHERLLQYLDAYFENDEIGSPAVRKAVMSKFFGSETAPWSQHRTDAALGTLIDVGQEILSADPDGPGGEAMRAVLEETDQLQKGEKAADVESQTHVEQQEDVELQELAERMAQITDRRDSLEKEGLFNALEPATQRDILRDAAGVEAERGAKTQTVENADGESVQITAADTESINGQTWYHGGAEGIETLLSSFTDIQSLYGLGVYTTDDEKVAKSYAKGRSVYPARVTLGTVLNLDEALPEDAAKAITAELFPEVRETGEATNAPEGITGTELFDAIRADIEDVADEQGWTKDDVTEMFQGIESGLRQAGYDALTHVGGFRAGKGKKPHRVLILLDPTNEGGGTDASGAELYEPLDVRVGAEPPPATSMPELLLAEERAITRLEIWQEYTFQQGEALGHSRMELEAEAYELVTGIDPGDTHLETDLPPVTEELVQHFMDTANATALLELSGLSTIEGMTPGHVEVIDTGLGVNHVWMIKLSKPARHHNAAESLLEADFWAAAIISDEDGQDTYAYITSNDMREVEKLAGWDEASQTGLSGTQEAMDYYTQVETPLSDAIKEHFEESEDFSGPQGMPEEGAERRPTTQPGPEGSIPAPHGMWHLRDPDPLRGTGRPLAAWKVIRRLAKLPALFGYKGVTDFPILEGGIEGKKYAGVHYQLDLVAKIRHADDMMTAFHEVGHGVEVILFGIGLHVDAEGKRKRKNPWSSKRIGTAGVEELLDMGKDLYGEIKPNGGYKREGWAEFLRLYISSRDELKTKAPNVLSWFENTILPRHRGAAKELDVLQAMVDRFRDQGVMKWARGMLTDPGSFEERFQAFRDAIITSPRSIMTQWVDSLHPLSLIEEQYYKIHGKEMPDVDRPYKWGTALRMQHSAVVSHMVNTEMLDWERNAVGPELRSIRGLIKPHQYKDLAIYLVARRSLAVMLDPVKPLLTPMNEQMAREIIDQLESEIPNLPKAADIFYKWNDGVLSYVAGADEFLKGMVERIREREKTRGDYAPLQRYFRIMNPLLDQYRGANTGFLDVIHGLRGSMRQQVIDPIQASISNAERLVLAAHNRKVIMTTVALSSAMQGPEGTLGMGNLIFTEVKGKELKTARNLESLTKTVLEYLKKELETDVMVTTGEGQKVELDELNLERQLIQFYGAALTPKNGEPIIPVKVDKPVKDPKTGKVTHKSEIKWFRMAPAVYEAIQGMSSDGMNTIRKHKLRSMLFQYGARTPAKMFRAGTVGFRASFGLVTNPLRDFQTLYCNSMATQMAFPLFLSYIQSFVEEGVSALTGGRVKSGYRKLHDRLGGQMTLALAQDTNMVRQAARDVTLSKNIGKRIARYVTDPKHIPSHTWNDWNTFLGFFKDLIQFPETAARITEIKAVAKDLGWKPGERMTEAIAQKLIIAGKQVTVDFTAAGELSRMYNQVVPFFNAAIQGPRAAGRAARLRPLKFGLRGMQMVGLALSLWWQYKDEDWWLRMDPRSKFLYLWFPVTIFDEETVVKVPLAHDSGQLFVGLAIALADAAYRTEPNEMLHWKEVGDWLDVVVESHMPIDLPWHNDPTGAGVAPTNAFGVLGKAFMEIGMNRKSYWGTPVVPPRHLGVGGADATPRVEQHTEYTTTAARWLGELSGLSPMQIDHAITSIAGPGARDLLVAGQSLDEIFTKRKFQSASDWPILGRVFRRGGRVGMRPLPIDELYDTYSLAIQRSGSNITMEDPSQRRERLLLQDATRSISLMFHIRSMTKDEKKKRAITKKAAELASSALSNVETMRLEREPFRLEKALQERERDRLLMQEHYIEGRTGQAEEIRQKLFKQKRGADEVIMRGFPGIENATSRKLLDERRFQYKRARAIRSSSRP